MSTYLIINTERVSDEVVQQIIGLLLTEGHIIYKGPILDKSKALLFTTSDEVYTLISFFNSKLAFEGIKGMNSNRLLPVVFHRWTEVKMPLNRMGKWALSLICKKSGYKF